MQPRLKIVNNWRLLPVAHYLETLGAKTLTLLVDASWKLWIQSTIILDDSPIGGNSLLPISPIFFGRLSRDANKDTRGQRTSYVGPKIPGQFSTQFTNSDKFAFGNRANQLIDELWCRDEHRAASKPRHLRGNVNNLRLLWLLDLFSPSRSTGEFRFHLVSLPSRHFAGHA